MNVEVRFNELFGTLPPITVDGKDYPVSFEIGSPDDLNKYLNQKQKEVSVSGGSIYPILWLETPIETDGNDTIRTMPIKLVLAELSNNNLSNRERLETTFKLTLNPLLKNVLTALRQSGFTKIIRDANNNLREYNQTNFFNYGTPDEAKHITTDIWDAIKLDLRLEMNTNCLQIINY